MDKQELQQVNERLLEKRKDLPPTQTASPTQSITSLPRMIRKVDDDESRICAICGKEMGCSYTADGHRPIWRCYTPECRKRDLINLKKEHPEKFLGCYGVPSKHLLKSLDNFKGNSKIVKICRDYGVEPFGSLFFTGSCGCGKTHLAVAILKEMVRNNLVGNEFGSNAEMKGATFTTAPELLLKIRQSFQESSGLQESDVIETYTNTPFLILDDLGAEKATEWAITTLYLIIDRRNREEKPTIFTTNLSLAEIEHQLSARIASRLADCKVVQLNMPDYRKLRK